MYACMHLLCLTYLMQWDVTFQFGKSTHNGTFESESKGVLFCQVYSVA